MAAILRPGNTGSNTAFEHVTVLDLALAQLPASYRPGHPGAGRVVLRSDSAGATNELAQARVDRGVEFSFGCRAKELVDFRRAGPPCDPGPHFDRGCDPHPAVAADGLEVGIRVEPPIHQPARLRTKIPASEQSEKWIGRF